MSAAASKSASPIIGTSSNRFSSRRRRANRSSVRAPARTSITTTSVMTRSRSSAISRRIVVCTWLPVAWRYSTQADRLFAGDQGREGGVLDEEVGEDAEVDDAGQGDADRHGEGVRRAGALDGGGLGRLGD